MQEFTHVALLSVFSYPRSADLTRLGYWSRIAIGPHLDKVLRVESVEQGP